MATIGEILKIFRVLQEEDITTIKLSQLTGYSQPYITQIEKNVRKPTNEFIGKISEVYNIPIKEFERIFRNANKKDYNKTRLYLEVSKVILRYEKEGKWWQH